jgi:hypothetical protein
MHKRRRKEDDEEETRSRQQNQINFFRPTDRPTDRPTSTSKTISSGSGLLDPLKPEAELNPLL